VNNAGYGIVGALEETSSDALQRIFATNFFGLVYLTQAVLPSMRAHHKGHIINMSSVAGVVVTPGFAAYNATKFAVEGVSMALSTETAHLGIKVTLVEPGPFRTDFAGRSIDTMPELEDYEPTVSKTRAYINHANGTQAGDPTKAAQILIAIANMSNPPLHLPLGNMSFDRIEKNFVKRLNAIQKNEALSRSADFAPGEPGYVQPTEFLDEVAQMRLDDEGPHHW
jgi:short-subunit dehydrogenase